jgi:hypothetical protein
LEVEQVGGVEAWGQALPAGASHQPPLPQTYGTPPGPLNPWQSSADEQEKDFVGSSTQWREDSAPKVNASNCPQRQARVFVVTPIPC